MEQLRSNPYVVYYHLRQTREADNRPSEVKFAALVKPYMKELAFISQLLYCLNQQ